MTEPMPTSTPGATSTAKARFDIVSWDEEPYDETGPKLVRGRVRCRYTGDMAGESTWEALMAYGTDGTASYVALERFTGTVAGRSGSVVLRQTGMFDGAVAHTAWAVLPGTGTGELSGLRGEGGYSAGEGRHVSEVVLHCFFA
ncbi:DUF3224 domain-containing protein [Gandjariella thermophila]|uniref:DUF3224 domain-containing protein n=1 Tax=Gandjariella thermophila TaxID=1931992 RepID=A0A4D4JAB7_9PSEU|nr:DUF3224 domain-containing protein [Gandjariella thermophila]GDY32262.1 hypothetical protein GTS_38950 [Gandjariella thermophila]